MLNSRMLSDSNSCCFFFFQAEDGIRDLTVTGVQTCALPIYPEFCCPERLLQRHGNQPTFTQRSKDSLGLGLVRHGNRESKAFEVLVTFALAVRCHQGGFADSDGCMRDFVVETIRQPVRVRALPGT